MPTSSLLPLARKLLSRWAEDPARYFRDVLGIEPWTLQEGVLRSVPGHARVAVRSGHKVSKSNSAAGLALWWVSTREDARAVLSSASSRQIWRILWRELRAMYRRARYPIGGMLHDDPESGLQFPDGREIVGFSTNEPERFSGISGRNLLFILDEASGIPEPIFEALEGNRAGGGRVILFSNPTRTSGTFYDAFHNKREFWHLVHISSEQSPNVVAKRIVIPGLATWDWVDEKQRDWGVSSPLYQVRVAGDFPGQAENAVIPLSIVEDALEAWEDTKAEGRLELGVDVARYGDDESVIFPRRGRRALPPRVERSMDSIEVAGVVLEQARLLRVPRERPIVKVDVIGYGAGTYDVLRRSPEVVAFPVNVGESATTEGYALLRDQLWFALRDWLAGGGAIPTDAKLEAELVAPTYSFDVRGRIKVEPKDKLKERLLRSPDRADGLALAVYTPPSGPIPIGWSPQPGRRYG